jgi:hypothetical protein
VTFSMVVRPGHPDFLDLPWVRPLADWRSGRLVEVERGIHRHVVRFVEYGERRYALKELSPRLAEREYRLLRRLEDESIPVVEAVGVVSRPSRPARRTDSAIEPDADAILITRLLLGRLLALQCPVSPRRRSAGRVPGRRRDRGAAPEAQ